DRVTGSLTRPGVSATTIGSARPLTLSADGRYLLILARGPGASHNVDLYDRVAGTSTLVSHAHDGSSAGAPQDETPALSADARCPGSTTPRTSGRPISTIASPAS